MSKPLNETLSTEISQQINSKAQTPFDNAYRAALLSEDSMYVQGFLVFAQNPYKPIEHAWIELNEQIVDPTLPYFHKNAQELYYFPAQRLSVKQLQAILEESKEDYPEDDPLPVYGATPYEYYGDIMLGGADYALAYQQAEAKCSELKSQN